MKTEDTHIILRAAGMDERTVDHPDEPADYVDGDGSIWTWRQRWRPVGGTRDGDRIVGRVHVRVYDLLRASDVTAGSA